MDDYTTLNPMSGGDKILTEQMTSDPTINMEAVKMRVGEIGETGTDVSDTNPLPVVTQSPGTPIDVSVNFKSVALQTLVAGVNGSSIYIQDILISTDGGASTTLIFKDDASSPHTIINKIYLPNSVDHVQIHFSKPRKIVTAEGFTVQSTSATPEITVDITGYVKED